MNCGHTGWLREHFMQAPGSFLSANMMDCVVQVVLIFSILLHICAGFTFNLCGYFINGGWCSTECRYEAHHAWGIPLCMHDGALGPKCCIPHDHSLIQGRNPSTTISTTTVAATLPQNTPEGTCGRARFHSRVRRVIGGNRAQAGTWPWQAALRLYTGQYVCGGVIISDRWVLTAAHCIHPPHDDLSLLRVYVGDQTLSYGRHGRENSKTIRRIIRHEDFQQDVDFPVTDPQTGETTVIRRHLHDIALIQLNESLMFSDDLRSICLPDLSADLSGLYEESDCWVAGWGQNHENTFGSTDTLYEVRGESLDHQQCGLQWGANFEDDVVCFTSQGRGPCQGDSGGGMACRRNDGRFLIVGIISWGREDCIHDDHPSVLTKVSTYRNWIDTHMQLLEV